jgi:malonate transporter
MGSGTLLLQILPIFAVIAAGAIAGRWERFGESAAAMLNDLVYYIALPALIFSSVAGADLSGGVPGSALVANVLVVLVAYTLGAGLALAARRPRTEANAVGLVGAWGNVGYLGIPLTVAVLGPATAFAASVTSTLHTALSISVFLVVATTAAHGEEPGGAGALVGKLAKRVLGNPVVIGIAAGAVFAVGGIPLPGPVAETVDLLAAMAAPGGLFALGILLRGALPALPGGRTRLAGIVGCVLVKLVVMPLLAAAAVHLFGVPAPWAAVLVVMTALPDAATVFVLTAQYRTWYRESTAVVVLTTVLSLVTLPVVVLVLP